MVPDIRNGAERIADERKRQVREKGYDAEHDAMNRDGELALVAALFATPIALYKKDADGVNEVVFCDAWPETWARYADCRLYDGNVLRTNERLSLSKRVRQLEKAGALIAAEIDRLLREKA